jgi:hypothetical protein
MSLSAGVAVVTQMLLDDQLPTMAKMHHELVRGGRDDVMEMRMEDFEADFNATVASLAVHVGVSAGCAEEGQPLQIAFVQHNVYALSDRERVQFEHTHWSSKSSNKEAEALHALLHGNRSLRHSLKTFGWQLGYTYPQDTPQDYNGFGGGSVQNAAPADDRR